MKVNFNKTFKDYRGNDLIVGGKVQLMTDIIAQCLFNGEGACLLYTSDAADD